MSSQAFLYLSEQPALAKYMTWNMTTHAQMAISQVRNFSDFAKSEISLDIGLRTAA